MKLTRIHTPSTFTMEISREELDCIEFALHKIFKIQGFGDLPLHIQRTLNGGLGAKFARYQEMDDKIQKMRELQEEK